MSIITYEAQHAALISGIPNRVNAKDWTGLSSDAADLATLEQLIAVAPTTVVQSAHGILTVMAKPLPDHK